MQALPHRHAHLLTVISRACYDSYWEPNSMHDHLSEAMDALIDDYVSGTALIFKAQFHFIQVRHTVHDNANVTTHHLKDYK